MKDKKWTWTVYLESKQGMCNMDFAQTLPNSTQRYCDNEKMKKIK